MHWRLLRCPKPHWNIARRLHPSRAPLIPQTIIDLRDMIHIPSRLQRDIGICGLPPRRIRDLGDGGCFQPAPLGCIPHLEIITQILIARGAGDEPCVSDAASQLKSVRSLLDELRKSTSRVTMWLTSRLIRPKQRARPTTHELWSLCRIYLVGPLVKGCHRPVY
jgi:hypothetical protein